MSRRSWNIQDAATDIKIVVDCCRRPRSETGGKFQPSAKAERLINEIGRLVSETERSHTGRQ